MFFDHNSKSRVDKRVAVLRNKKSTHDNNTESDSLSRHDIPRAFIIQIRIGQQQT